MAEKSGVAQEQVDGKEQRTGGSGQTDEVSQRHPGEVQYMQMYIRMYMLYCVYYVYVYIMCISTYKVVHIQCIRSSCIYVCRYI